MVKSSKYKVSIKLNDGSSEAMVLIGDMREIDMFLTLFQFRIINDPITILMSTFVVVILCITYCIIITYSFQSLFPRQITTNKAVLF